MISVPLRAVTLLKCVPRETALTQLVMTTMLSGCTVPRFQVKTGDALAVGVGCALRKVTPEGNVSVKVMLGSATLPLFAKTRV